MFRTKGPSPSSHFCPENLGSTFLRNCVYQITHFIVYALKIPGILYAETSVNVHQTWCYIPVDRNSTRNRRFSWLSSVWSPFPVGYSLWSLVSFSFLLPFTSSQLSIHILLMKTNQTKNLPVHIDALNSARRDIHINWWSKLRHGFSCILYDYSESLTPGSAVYFGCYVCAVEQLLLVLVTANPPVCAQTVNCLQKFNTNLLHNTFLLSKSFTCFGLTYWPKSQTETCRRIN
jgi:hypothetical protein